MALQPGCGVRDGELSDECTWTWNHLSGGKISSKANGLYYKHVTIINYASSGINKLRASLNDNTRVIIYDHHMFIIQATGVIVKLVE